VSRRLKLVAVLWLLGLPGCGGNSLGGSISDAFDLNFSDIVIRRSTKAVQITYLRSEGNEVVMRITVDLEDVDVTKGGSVDLAEEYAPGHPRAAVSRAMNGEPVLQLPPVVQGTLTLSDDPAPGNSITGEFSARFGEGGDLGSGRTLNGKFSGVVEGTDG
jgi:hypothetical protein